MLNGGQNSLPTLLGFTHKLSKVKTMDENQTRFTLTITDVGDDKASVIKVIRTGTGISLAQAIALLNVPAKFMEDVDSDQAAYWIKAFEDIGAQIEISEYSEL